MSKLEKLITELPACRQAGAPMEWYVYVLLCDDGSLYKGFTDNLSRRFQEHLSGRGSVHTKKHKPIKIVYYETFDTEKEAVARENYLKSGSGREWLKAKVQEGTA
ncbi:MAG: GIY-YIG nuclease family protein [Oscillospiraceae bacterium]|jgi:predicted GIY-YIG superfamily endonuclease|nr:GIY-YIG nuclease family protein [Oscillospiraceae bacterium]